MLTTSLACLSSCYELQSDEELREDIVGTWIRVDCKPPYGDNGDDLASSLLNEELIFNSDRSIIEGGYNTYCCEIECDTVWQGSCTWIIENGAFEIVPAGSSEMAHLNRSYPILCLKKNRLVIDNIIISNLKREKTCYCRN